VPSRLISSQDILRYIHRSTDDARNVPELHLDWDEPDVYKGEIVINYSKSNPGLFIRVGAGSVESAINDQLVRIGNIFVGDTEPLAGIDKVIKRGLGWYNTTDNHFYLHTGAGFERITNQRATEVITGIVRQATYAETILGFEDTGYVTPNKLRRWADYYEFVPRRHGATEVYISRLDGDDSLENDGSDPRYPFLSINRAVLESARREIRVIKVAAGDYLVDNRPGNSDITSISPPTHFDKDGKPIGPINSTLLDGVVLDVSVEGTSGTLLVEESIMERLYRDQQLFFEKDGVLIGSVLINSVDVELTKNQVPFRQLRGEVIPGCLIRVARYRSFNSLTGGLVLPGSYTLTCDGQTTLRPLYVSRYNSLNENDRSYLIKVASGCKIEKFTFVDNIAVNHFMYSALGNASEEDLKSPDVGYIQRVQRALSIEETTPYWSYAGRSGPFLRVDDCSLDSAYGASFMTLSHSCEDCSSEVLVNNLTVASYQMALDAYVEESLESDPTILEGLEHWVVNVINGDYKVIFNGGHTKYVPQFSIVDADSSAMVYIGSHLLLEDIAPNPNPVEV
jgi:hypothetical protein